MGLLDIFRPKHAQQASKVVLAPEFKTLTEYAPAFSTWGGQLYEKALTRSAIEKSAMFASKLKPEVLGDSKPRIKRMILTAPNQYMSWPKMLARLMTIMLNDNTAAVVPSLDTGGNITGLFPLKFAHAEVVEYAGEPWIRFYLDSGDTMAIELRYVCLLTRFQYESDFFGSANDALNSTLALMDYQEQAQEVAIKNSAKIQFIGAINGSVRPEDLDRKRKEFSETNLSSKNTSGLMLYDNTFENIKQVEPQNYTIDSGEMERIETNVYNYFGINEDIIQSKYSEETFGAFYESQIEPFAVQLGEGLSQMLFTPIERRHGNGICFSANRLEYATNASKRNMIRDMLDRRVMTINESREVLQLPPVPGGDVFIERGEYVVFDADGNVRVQTGGKTPLVARPKGNSYGEGELDLEGDDAIYNDVDTKGKKEEDD